MILKKLKSALDWLKQKIQGMWTYLRGQARWRERFYFCSVLGFTAHWLLTPFPALQHFIQPATIILVLLGVFALVLETFDWLKNSVPLRYLLLVLFLPTVGFILSSHTAEQMLYNLTKVPPASFTRAIGVMTVFTTLLWVLILVGIVAIFGSFVFNFLSSNDMTEADNSSRLVVRIGTFFERQLKYRPTIKFQVPKSIQYVILLFRGASLLLFGLLVFNALVPALNSPLIMSYLARAIVQIEYLEPTHCKLPKPANLPSAPETRRIVFSSDGKISVATPTGDGYAFSVLEKCN